MVQETRTERPRIVPMIAYENGAAAIDWLVRAFGFRELERITATDGTISHAELDLEGGRIFLATPTPDYQGPKRHRETCAAAKRWSAVPWVIDGLSVQVDSVDAHFARAKGAGATILSEPQDNPYGRLYRAEDLEGHRWMFIEEH